VRRPDARADRLRWRFPWSHHVRLALTGKVAPYKIKFGPFPGEIFHVPFPNALQGVSEDDSIAGHRAPVHDQHRSLARRGDLHRTGAGRRRLHSRAARLPAPPAGLCDTHGILLVADEVQTGIARCGKLFASEHYGVEPDIITMAKGLGGGLPVAAVVGKAQMMDAADVGGLGSTYAGNPVAVAGALAVLDVVEEEQLCARSMALGERMRSRFGAMMEQFSIIAEVRGLGAMTAVEFCRNGDPRQPAADIATALKNEAANVACCSSLCGRTAMSCG
jgi:4-aminobutyrate aminotransferase/(S)-3-amino-2-methylpropionate transaminase